MATGDLSFMQVGTFIRGFGYYRTTRTQRVAREGEPDGIAGVHWIALGLRETHLKNINGGAVWDEARDIWVPAPPEHRDAGVFQISRDWHPADLKRMPGVKEGTWGPVVEGVTAFTPGYCPRFEESLQYLKLEFGEALAFAEDEGVEPEDRARFAIAAHNAGKWGALNGYAQDNVDKYTALGNYSAWVLRHVTLVRKWLYDHPNWKI